MAFKLNEFMAARAKKGYTTNAQLLEAYNKRFRQAGQTMSAQTLSYKLRGRTEWTRQEIANIASLLDLSSDTLTQIFFAD